MTRAKQILAALAVFCVPCASAFSQGAQRISVALANVGNYARVLANAQITVCSYNIIAPNVCTSPIIVYQDPAMTIPYTPTGKLHADSNGNYSYWVAAGSYWEQTCATGTLCQTRLITLSVAGGVSAFNGRVGGVAPQSGDYTAAQITNAADKGSTSAQGFNGPLSGPSLNFELLGVSYAFASAFPSSCTVGGVAYTGPLECAWRTALATTTAVNALVILEPGVSYTTCAGLPMILPGAMGSFSVGLETWGENAGHNSGGFAPNNVATIKQTCAISTGTLSLPEVGGSAFKQLSVSGVSIDANHLAPYAMQIVGQNESSVFRDIQVANGTTGPAVLGTAFDFTNGFTVNATLDNWQIVDNCGVVNGCGGGGAVTVNVTGGVPTGTITGPGSNYDSNTIATLVGYQNGTRNTPCTSMGVTTPTISGGGLTGQGFTTTATGCVLPMYVQFTDERAPRYGLDLENVTDSRGSGFDIRTGAIAGLFCQGCGSDIFNGVHPWGQGLFGIKSNSFTTFVGTDCGEVSLACFDNASTSARTTAIGTMYNSGSQFQGFSLFRNETSSSKFKILGVQCQSAQTAEYHTLANVFGVIDTNAQATSVNTLGNSLKDAEYCGSGTGETLNVIPGNETVLGSIVSPGTQSLNTNLMFSLNSTPFVDCTANGFTQAPTISGSVITFLSNGADNSGSVTCTDFGGRVTIQSVPNSGTPTVSQTFNMTSQFATSGATWIRLDPALSSGSILLNAPNITVQNGTMAAGTGGTINATFPSSVPSLSIVPAGTATTTPLTALQSGLATGSQVRAELGANFSNFNAGLLFFQYQGGAGSVTNRFGLQLPGAPSGGVYVDGQGIWNAPAIAVIGTTFTASGCSNSSLFGGATAGQFTSGTTGTCAVVITTGLTASHGYACFANDLTTPADTIKQTASSATTATLSGTTTTADVINFHCDAY